MNTPVEYSANIEQVFIPTLVRSNWKGTGRQVTMNTADYRPERDGEIISGPTQPPVQPGHSDPPLKNPKLDAEGRRIADLHSPMHRA